MGVTDGDGTAEIVFAELAAEQQLPVCLLCLLEIVDLAVTAEVTLKRRVGAEMGIELVENSVELPLQQRPDLRQRCLVPVFDTNEIQPRQPLFFSNDLRLHWVCPPAK